MSRPRRFEASPLRVVDPGPPASDTVRAREGLLRLLDGMGGDFHAIEARLAEIANVLPVAIMASTGETRAALKALAELL